MYISLRDREYDHNDDRVIYTVYHVCRTHMGKFNHLTTFNNNGSSLLLYKTVCCTCEYKFSMNPSLVNK